MTRTTELCPGSGRRLLNLAARCPYCGRVTGRVPNGTTISGEDIYIREDHARLVRV